MRTMYRTLITATVALTLPGAAIAAAKPHHPARHVAPVNPSYLVGMDQAKVVTFDKPVTTVFVGNPSIADATIIDSRHAYILGKTFGVTNVIGLDADHNAVVNKQIVIANRSAGAVTVTRGIESYNYSCTAVHCETMPRPGDPNPWFANTEGSANSHEDMAMKAGAAQGPQ